MSTDRRDLRCELEAAIEAALSDEVVEKASKEARDIADNLSCEIDYRIKSDLAYNLAWWVQRMAGDAVKAMLSGDEGEMRRYLSCVEGGYNGRDQNHPVIHGTLFESGCLALRKQIVDAYPELLRNERILDLEDQVESLVKEINRLERANQELVSRYAV